SVSALLPTFDSFISYWFGSISRSSRGINFPGVLGWFVAERSLICRISKSAFALPVLCAASDGTASALTQTGIWFRCFVRHRRNDRTEIAVASMPFREESEPMTTKQKMYDSLFKEVYLKMVEQFLPNLKKAPEEMLFAETDLDYLIDLSHQARTIADIGAETHALGLVDEAEASRN